MQSDWETLEEHSKQHVRHTLAAFKGNISNSARALGINRKTLHSMMKRWDIQRKPYNAPSTSPLEIRANSADVPLSNIEPDQNESSITT